MTFDTEAFRLLIHNAAKRSLDVVSLDSTRAANPVLAKDLRMHVSAAARLPYVSYAAGWEAGGVLRLGFLVPSKIQERALVREVLRRYVLKDCALESDSEISRDFNCDYLALNPDALSMEFDIEMMLRRSSSKWITRVSA